MAIAFVRTAQGSVNFGSSVTFAIDGTGADCLIVGVSNNGTAQHVTGITYNGVALTKYREDVSTSPATSIWRLVAPASGSNNVIISADTSCDVNAFASMWSGVDQTTPIDSGAGGTNGFQTSPRSDNITVSGGGYAVDILHHEGTNGAATAFAVGGSQTQLGTTISNGNERIGASYLTAASAMSWTWSSGQDSVAHTVAALKSAAGGGSPTLPQLERGIRGLNRGVAQGSY